jgi:hypothetical protein
MKSILRTAAVLSALLVFTLTACQNPMPTASPLASPLNSPVGQPPASAGGTFQVTGPGFALDVPILLGASKVTGQGPLDVPIVIVDVTMNARPIGSGTIGKDGKFSISLDKPAVEGHILGIQVGSGFQFTPENSQQLLGKKGPGFKDYPQIGVVFDSATVRKP